MEKLVKKIKFQTSITLVTGLHIGGSNDCVGGIDLGTVTSVLAADVIDQRVY